MSDKDMKDMEQFLSRLEGRLHAIDDKLEALAKSRHKSMEWIATLSEHVRSLDDFREEVRASFEPLLGKLDALDDVMRILRHATSDVSRRVESVERQVRLKAS